MAETKRITPGDMVICQMKPWLTNVGEYWGRIKHTRRWQGEQMVFVLFKNHRWPTRVPLSKIKLAD